MKKIIERVLFALLGGVVALLAACCIFGINVFRLGDQLPLLHKLVQVDNWVSSYYLEEYDTALAADYAAAGYASSLGDDYAGYYPASGYEQKLHTQAGESQGIGVTITKHPDTGAVMVVELERQGPAAAAGMREGDIITAVNGESVAEMSVSEVGELVRGSVGEQRLLSLTREGEPLELTVELADYVGDSVRWRRSGEVGVISILNFDDTTVGQFEQALEQLSDDGVTALVFDLRGNPGGTVDSCVEVLDRLLPEGELLRTQSRSGEIKVTNYSDARSVELPMAVVVNSDTASCGELFTLAMRELGGAKVAGETTFGKGVIQTSYLLSDGSAVKFTTQKVIDKNGGSYHEVGITPDKTVELSESQQLYRSFLSDSEDPQLQAAINLLKK